MCIGRIAYGPLIPSSTVQLTTSPTQSHRHTHQAVADAQQRRAQGRPTVPSTIGKELATNPFMRVSEASVRTRVEGSEGIGPEAVLGAIRELKNGFKG